MNDPEILWLIAERDALITELNRDAKQQSRDEKQLTKLQQQCSSTAFMLRRRQQQISEKRSRLEQLQAFLEVQEA